MHRDADFELLPAPFSGAVFLWEEKNMNQSFRPDPTFHPTPRMAMDAPVETLAFTLMLSPDFSQPDGLAVVGVDPSSDTYGKIVHQVIMPNKGDEFHHFGWNACSSSLSPLSGHAFLERRGFVAQIL
jgi:selenium-binding protein 1